jgi:hypothetical protein
MKPPMTSNTLAETANAVTTAYLQWLTACATQTSDAIDDREPQARRAPAEH